MKKTNQKRIMAIFIGVVMLASIAEVALLRNTPGDTQQTTTLPSDVNRKLTLAEVREVLLSRRAIIEYFYNESCIDCVLKERMYQEFVSSGQFKDYVVLSHGVWNETADWLLDLTGTQYNMSSVSTSSDLKKLFCGSDIATLKPNVCLLEDM